MKFMIDTNIILDVFLDQEPFSTASKEVLNLCENGKIQGLISASSATDIFYIVRKRLGNPDKAYEALGHVLNIVKVLTVTNEDVNTAFRKKARDFEDCLLATCAKSNRCSAIITRNKEDFKGLDIDLYSPEELLDQMNSQRSCHEK